MRRRVIALVLAWSACARAQDQHSPLEPERPAETPAPLAGPPAPVVERPGAPRRAGAAPTLPPQDAHRAGLMPLSSAGVDRFRTRHPTYDGRGVVIGILDSGIDPGVDGLHTTSVGSAKILDLRDFSGEGVVTLTPTTPTPQETLRIGSALLRGAGRIARIATTTPWYVGELRERALGMGPAADLNGDGSNTDVFPLVVVKASDGWVVFLDTNLDGSFEDETPLHDYRVGHETLGLGTKPMTLAADFDEAGGVPSLDFFFDNSGHGTHVAGIAAGHNLFGVPGFDGVAPGAELLGLKVADNSRGGLAVTGSLERALAYAARYADVRGLRLVVNLSFGVGSENPLGAVIDSVLDGFLVAHPSVVLAVSAGNDGPGLSTAGVPGASDLALSTGATFPGAFRTFGQGVRAGDLVGWWSARGGALAKPDLVAPGVAYSAVPPFERGREVKGGTSMAAPYAAGLAACLESAMAQEGRVVNAIEITQALRASARHLPGASVLDEGAGEPELDRAYRWLEAGHQGSQYVVRTTGGVSAAFFRDGPPPDSAVFRVRPVAGLRAAAVLLRRDVAWVEVPPIVAAGAVETLIPVHYTLGRGVTPGVYTGTVGAWNPSDSLAGPLFRLVTTVVVPYDLARESLTDSSRSIAAGRIERYFVRAPEPNGTLAISVTLGDSLTERATARLYEPSGRPARDADELEIDPGATGRFEVTGEDLDPGVYELDVIAAPRARVTATVYAAVAPLELELAHGTLEARNAGARTASGVLHETLVGAERRYAVAATGAGRETVTFTTPAWASAAVLDVELPKEEWDRLTGFGVTAYDSNGAVLAQGPMNGTLGRERFELPPAVRGRPVTIELLPAFAHGPGEPWRASLAVRFPLPRPEPVGLGRAVVVVGGGRVELAVVSPPPLAAPAGFAPLVAIRIHPSGGGADAVRNLTVGP